MTPRCTRVCLLLLIALSGCGQEYIENEYGRQRLPGTAGSVNGTDVLAAMFEDAGHKVHTRRTLVTDEMSAADVVVWFPNDSYAPREEVCDWFDEWLIEEPGRTLIFVGREFDAAPQYWDFHYNRKPEPDAPGNHDRDTKSKSKQKDVEKSVPESDPQDESQVEDDEDEDPEDAKSPSCRWFTYEPGRKVTVRELSGPWADGIDAAKARIEVRTRLLPEEDHEVLLGSEIGPIVSRLTPPYSEGSQIILVENGSFLLNLPLINHEHRKLAGKLVAAVGGSGTVVFLESRPGGPPIDPPPSDSSLWTLFQGWPLGAILLQLGVAGIIFCFARWPIFGRPRQPAGAATTDFSDHVAAVGELLAKSRDPSLTSPPETPAPATRVPPDPRSASSLLR